MKTICVCLVLGQLAAFAEPEVSPDDFAVWRSVIQSVTPEKTTYIWYQIERSEVYDYKAMEGFRSSMKLLTDELFAGFNKRNWDRRRPIELTDGFRLAQPVTLLTPELMTQHCGRVLNEGWWLNPSVLPNGGLVVRVSLPAYSRDGSTAFVLGCLYQPDRADQGYFILRRQNDESWKIKEKKIWWSADTPNYTSR
jgi:hypothetical protein